MIIMLVKNIKSKIAGLLTGVMMVSTLAGVPAQAAGYDSTAPEITSLEVSGESFNVGDTINFNMGITEEETGVVECVLSFTSIRDDRRFVNLTGNGWTGDYTGSFTIDESFPAGEYTIDWIKIVDAQGNETMCPNEFVYKYKFTVANENDTAAPLIDAAWVENETIDVTEADVSQTFVCHSDDTDIAKIEVQYMFGDVSRTETIDITSVAEDGNYSIKLPHYSTDPAGKWDMYKLVATDINNNSSTQYLSIAYDIISNIIPEEEVEDVTTFDSVAFDAESIIIPSTIGFTVTGTTTKDTASGTVVIRNKETNEEIFSSLNGAVAEDGTYVASANIIVSNNHTAGEWELEGFTMNDNYFCNFDSEVLFTAVNELEDLYIHTSLSNPKLIDIIKDADEGSTILLTPNGADKIPAEVFTTIDNHDKTIMVDLDGVKWIFNGNDIEAENIKDVDFSTSVEETNLVDYGYGEDAEGVAVIFAPNGVLPGKANIKIKSDYISSKFNLNSKLFLAFIKESADDESELEENVTESTDDEVANDTTASCNIQSEISSSDISDIEAINMDSEKLVRIEDAGITMDEDGYVTVTMYHNSSYILSNSLPVTKETVTNTGSEVNENNDNVQQPTNNNVAENTQPTNNNEIHQPDKPVIATIASVTPSKEFKISKVITKAYKKSIKITCKVKDAKGYQIKYKAGSDKYKTVTVKSMKSKTITGLKRHKKYTIKVRAYKIVKGKKVWTSWKTVTKKTK